MDEVVNTAATQTSKRAQKRGAGLPLPETSQGPRPADDQKTTAVSHRIATSTRRRSTGARSRGRESNIAGLVERSRQAAVDRPLLPLPDLLLSTMSSLRQLLQNSTLDESANRVIDGLAEPSLQRWPSSGSPILLPGEVRPTEPAAWRWRR